MSRERFTILLSPIGVKDNELIAVVKNSLLLRFNASIIVERKVSMGYLIDFYDERREQVNAENLITNLRREMPSNPLMRILFLIDADGYVSGLNFVFGIASYGWGGIVFLQRLKPEFYGLPSQETLFRVRVVKESLHELGHSLGLTHCNERTCVMRFSNTIWEVDTKSPDYCNRCKLLIERSYPGLIRVTM
ncbi:MAG TPA: hypothetical protein ENF80_00670 [Thermofilum sp.]|nr:hypothetical protein [Thermofilum sp.]